MKKNYRSKKNLGKFGARIKVAGVGGSGSNAVDHMINSGVHGVDFIVANCDVQDLHHSKADKKVHIGKNLTRGLGAGMNPEVGRLAAEETKNEIQDALKGADMVFITCGLGGGTGTGASPIVAEAARSQGSLTIAVVTRPFSFEGAERARIAEEGLGQLIEIVDTVIIIPNDRLLEITDKKTTIRNAFALCDDVLKNAVQGISELIVMPGIINLDFADVKTIMGDAGPAIMGVGSAQGDKRAAEAARKAIGSPLLDISIDGARGILFAVAGGEDLTLSEINEAAKIITESADPQAKIIFGAFQDDTIDKGSIKITVIATGFSNPGPNIISSPKVKRFDMKETETDSEKNNSNESRDDRGDGNTDTPAFMRRGKPPLQPPKFGEDIKDKKKQRGVRAAAFLEDVRPIPRHNEFLSSYAASQTRSNPRDFYEEDNGKHPVARAQLEVGRGLRPRLLTGRAKSNSPGNIEINAHSLIKKVGELLFIFFALALTVIIASAMGVYTLIKFLKSHIVRMIRGR